METPFLTICRWHSHLLDQEFLSSVVKTFFVNGPSCCGSLFCLMNAFQGFHDVSFVFCTGFLSCQRIPRCLRPRCEFQEMLAECFHGCPPTGQKWKFPLFSKYLTYNDKLWLYLHLQNHMRFKKAMFTLSI